MNKLLIYTNGFKRWTIFTFLIWSHFFYSQNNDGNENCNQNVIGHVFNKTTMQPIPGAEVSLIDDSGNIIAEVITSELGEYSFDLLCEHKYILLVKKKAVEYFDGNTSFSEEKLEFVSSKENGFLHKMDLYLEKFTLLYGPPNTDFFFPWPPPIASAKTSLPKELFKNCKTFSDVQFILKKALEDNGYEDIVYMAMVEGRSYLRKLNGFATVSKMEQINKNGSSKREKYRWSAKVSTDISSIGDYIQALFFTRPGYFRVIVFVVVDEQFNSVQQASRDDAMEWLRRGSPYLEPELASSKFTENHEVISLIYEYRLDKNEKVALLSMPSELSGKKHLEKSKILKTLNKN